jgi:hypothetical protein
MDLVTAKKRVSVQGTVKKKVSVQGIVKKRRVAQGNALLREKFLE